ncbi:FYVE zinc finger-domain-containing protein [Cerioporus squamosus]|nr:FYVE zinc finger-domain-containing protein [Cerioporus squamosus]
MENPPYVPYQAYKPKRHNRVLSNPHATPSPAPPPAQARPASTLINGHTYSEPLVSLGADDVADAEKRSIALLNGRNPLQRPVSMIDTLTHQRQDNPHPYEPHIEKPLTTKPVEKPLPSPVEVQSPVPAAPTSPSVSSAPSPLATPPSTADSPRANVNTVAQSSSPVAGPSTLSPAPKSSTFRHIRPPAPRPALPSSPLRPASMHVQSASTLRLHLHEPRSGASSVVSTPTMTPHDRALPAIPNFELQSQRSPSLPPMHTPSPTPIAPLPAPAAHPHRASTLMASPMHDSVPSSHPPSAAPSPALTPSTSTSSAVPSASRTPTRTPAPPRTDEFIEARNHSRDVGRIERTRLERRLEKLINLHFPPPGQRKLEAPEPRPQQQNRRASSFWDLDLSDLRSKSAGELWREVVQSQASQGGKNDIRAAEQKITPWEDDASVSQCPLCSATFHPLTNRKHHCRLCGRIICSLPVKYPQRPQTCSLLFVVDQSTGRIEEVGEGVDYGVRRRSTATPGKPQKRGEALPEEEKFLKGVRICRECRPILLRQEYRQEMGVVPLFSRLYDAFISLEKEIEEELPLFQRSSSTSAFAHPCLLRSSKQERPTPEAAAARKRLLEAFAQYDALAKRIRKLPCPPGSSQERIQAAIISRANLFLQKNMFPLQTLPKPKKVGSPSAASPAPPEDQIIDPDSEVARVLQPLLEQEALLETFVEEAKAHRKFEDVRTLKNNLREIRAEIERILANAEEQTSAGHRSRTS